MIDTKEFQRGDIVEITFTTSKEFSYIAILRSVEKTGIYAMSESSGFEYSPNSNVRVRLIERLGKINVDKVFVISKQIGEVKAFVGRELLRGVEIDPETSFIWADHFGYFSEKVVRAIIDTVKKYSPPNKESKTYIFPDPIIGMNIVNALHNDSNIVPEMGVENALDEISKIVQGVVNGTASK